MKSRRGLLILVSIITILSVILWNIANSDKIGKQSNVLKDIEASEIAEITICNPIQYYTITRKDDVLKLWQVLQSMVLCNKPNNDKDGYAFTLDIQLVNGEMVKMSVLSNDIRIDGHNYQPGKDYCDDIGIIFNELSKKYQIIPA